MIRIAIGDSSGRDRYNNIEIHTGRRVQTHGEGVEEQPENRDSHRFRGQERVQSAIAANGRSTHDHQNAKEEDTPARLGTGRRTSETQGMDRGGRSGRQEAEERCVTM